ncbi:hypothetical protein Bca4012_005392 [Brassica carinata]|uniref:(rape) hypothetical protein n=1 Tax=Brassica napus TaxID=3708 RepID=A0A816ICQ7_BRANA|nr:unnamed protein product [Brassica napus]
MRIVRGMTLHRTGSSDIYKAESESHRMIPTAFFVIRTLSTSIHLLLSTILGFFIKLLICLNDSSVSTPWPKIRSKKKINKKNFQGLKIFGGGEEDMVLRGDQTNGQRSR